MTKTLADHLDAGVDATATMMLDAINALVRAQGDRPPGSEARTKLEQAQAGLAAYLAYAPTRTQKAEEWREEFIKQHPDGPAGFVRYLQDMGRLAADPNTALEAVLTMTNEQRDHWLTARAAGLYEPPGSWTGSDQQQQDGERAMR